jgi:hypothetical protein
MWGVFAGERSPGGPPAITWSSPCALQVGCTSKKRLLACHPTGAPHLDGADPAAHVRQTSRAKCRRVHSSVARPACSRPRSGHWSAHWRPGVGCAPAGSAEQISARAESGTPIRRGQPRYARRAIPSLPRQFRLGPKLVMRHNLVNTHVEDSCYCPSRNFGNTAIAGADSVGHVGVLHDLREAQ